MSTIDDEEKPQRISILTRTWRSLKKTATYYYNFGEEKLAPLLKRYAVFILSGNFFINLNS